MAFKDPFMRALKFKIIPDDHHKRSKSEKVGLVSRQFSPDNNLNIYKHYKIGTQKGSEVNTAKSIPTIDFKIWKHLKTETFSFKD
jgi:hypothetical protein